MSVEHPDRFEQLRHDHLHLNRLVEDLRGSLQACLRGEADPVELFSEVEEFLAAAEEELFEHFDAEESALFPYVVEKLPETKPQIRSLENGHDKICGTLTRLERAVGHGDPSRFAEEIDAFVALFARFDANYSKHAIEEEALLRSLGEELDPASRNELARLLAEI